MPRTRKATSSALGAFSWHLDADMHPDNFIGDTACWWIADRKNTDPLFLQIGFPGPHPPYDPLPEALAAYAEVDFPLPDVTAAELRAQPRAQQALRDNMIEFNFDSIAWRRDVSREDLLRLRRHYAANVSMIDEQIGRILQSLNARGYLDDALVIFTSDHADALGDHGHIQKWTMYDSVVRVPLIFWSKNLAVQPGRRDELVQMFDIAPTVLETAGLTAPADFEARSLWGSLSQRENHQPRDAVYAELARDHIQTGSEFILMRRDTQWKIVVYLDDTQGELYDLEADPGELHNRWEDASLRALRDELSTQCLRWLARGTLAANRRPGRAPQRAMRV